MTTPTPPDPSRRVTISVPAWVASLSDPGVQVLGVLAVLGLAGFGMFALGWHGVARTVYVPFQLPWMISASIGGIGLLGFTLGAWSIHVGRRQDAAHRAVVEDLVRDAAELVEGMVRTGALAERVRGPRRTA